MNPSERTRKEASPLLATLTRFLTSLLRSRDTICRLDHMSHRDQLTGLMNRWSFMEYVHHLKPGQKAAFLFGDMNGLKKVNDSQGHEAGDRALIALGCARRTAPS
ncbi:GGDEF domain-containing protein [uncultured Dialister sp.]|uniref:GGDEF domain-containing protein n=1 Tax=uncultured Dialister sp. TaxID=278064 RepID=UPI0027DB12AB|nr:GGDEF domain-containing protein [uncultured Dialister sp.]